MSLPVSRSQPRVTALRPTVIAGLTASAVSISAMVVIRLSPSLEGVVAGVHLAVTLSLYVLAGMLASRMGAQGWRAGLMAGLVDVLVGHAISFLISTPPDASKVSLPAGVDATPQVLASVHLWGAVVGAAMAVGLATLCGALGGLWVRRRAGLGTRG
jgi:hypothetical protein